MSNFQTHITASSVLGVAYGVVGLVIGIPITSAVIGGGLCSLAGMLPDLDSGSGIPVRETTNLAAAITPILLLDRFATMGLGHEQMVVAAGGVYLFIRFGVARSFKNYTVHRGMWHSVPAAVIAATFGFMLCSCHSSYLQWYKAIAVFLGFMSHLVLDELNSLEVKRGRLRIKKSFGTAIKFWSRRSLWANVSTYGKLILVLALAFGDRMYYEAFIDKNRDRIRVAREFLGDIHVDYGYDHSHNSTDDPHDPHHEEDGEPRPANNSARPGSNSDEKAVIRNREILLRR
jgi:hypothetical protein